MGKRQKEEFSSFRLLLKLLSNVELFDDRTIAVDVYLGQVVQKISSVTNHLQQTATGVMIIGVLLQMLGQLIDPSGQDRDLDLGRTSVCIVQLISGDNRILDILLQHCIFHLSFRFARHEPRYRPVKANIQARSY